MTAYLKFTDEQLVALLNNGDQLAFAEIYRRYAESLAGFAASKLFRMEDARDIMQDLFVKLWENREQVRITSTLQSYLFAVIRHKIIDKIRKNITREEYASALQSLACYFQPASDKQLEAKELHQAIQTSIGQLPARVKEIYQLSREEGLTNQEIAQKLNLSEQTVKNQLSTALKHLRRSLMRISPLVFMAWWLHL
jgi:RNA polymerase sigma-70 factor (ECF subfamily)